MTPEKVISILEGHNRWRRGEETREQDPSEIGTAIDLACQWLKKSMHIPKTKPAQWKKKQVGISDDGAAVYGETLVPASESNCGKVRYPDKKAAVSAINFRRQFRGAPQN